MLTLGLTQVRGLVELLSPAGHPAVGRLASRSCRSCSAVYALVDLVREHYQAPEGPDWDAVETVVGAGRYGAVAEILAPKPARAAA